MGRVQLFADSARLDIRHAWRQWRRAPGATLLALLVLTLGIGANLALFGLFNAVVLRPLPIRDPDRLVTWSAINPKDPDERPPLPYAALGDLDRRQTTFASLAAVDQDGVTAEINGALRQVAVSCVSERYFEVLQLNPAWGRLLTAEDVKNRAHVAVVTHEYWRRHYAGDPLVVGTVVRLQGIPFTIVGVLAPGFSGLNTDIVDAFVLPITASPLFDQANDSETLSFAYAIGRLKPNADAEGARRQLDAIWAVIRALHVPPQLTGEARDRFLTLTLALKPANRGFSLVRDWWTSRLALLVGATTWMLLIACMNLASLSSARLIRRRSDLSMRGALGASRWRLVQQEVCQSLLLTLAGTVCALPLASWSLHVIGRLLFFWQTFDLPSLSLAWDWRVAGVTVSSVALTSVAIGVVPAIRATRRDLYAHLHGDRATSRLISRWAERLLVAQIATAVILLVGAGLFSKSLATLRAIDTGIPLDGLSLLNLAPAPGRDLKPDPPAYSTKLADRLGAVAGVRGVAFSWEPFAGLQDAEWQMAIRRTGVPSDAAQAMASFFAVSPHFFQTTGIPLRIGREFQGNDDNAHVPVAVVSAALALRLFRGEWPLGRQIDIGDDPRQRQVTIVGVSADARLGDLHNESTLFVWRPLLQASTDALQMPTSVVIRSTGSWTTLQPTIRRTIESLGQDYVVESRPFKDQVNRSLLRDRVLATGATTFGGVAVALVAVGLWGVIGSIVAARTREIGIRAVLGASPKMLRGMVLRQGLRVTLWGTALGLPCAWIGSRWLQSLLTGVSPHDPLTYLVIVGGLVAVSLVASSVPAHRAATVDPLVALRTE